MAAYIVLLIALLVVVSSSNQVAMATDPGQLQDFCVADLRSNVHVNGFVCKDPNQVVADDFFYHGLLQDLNMAGNTNNKVGTGITPVNVNQLAGLNTLGIALARVDFAHGGVNPPHYHPRASEVLTVIRGSLLVGFMTSDPDYKLFTKVLNQGDVFVFPQGLVHFQINHDCTAPALTLVAHSSQNPGLVTVANALLGSRPVAADDVLMKTFHIVDPNVLNALKRAF